MNKVILFISCLFLSSCIFDSSYKTLKNSRFKWGYVNDEKFLDIVYNSQGIFGNETVYGIVDLDSIVLLQCVKPEIVSFYNSDFKVVDSSSYYYILNTYQYEINPIQKESSAILGPITKDSLNASVSIIYGLNKIEFKKWYWFN